MALPVWDVAELIVHGAITTVEYAVSHAESFLQIVRRIQRRYADVATFPVSAISTLVSEYNESQQAAQAIQNGGTPDPTSYPGRGDLISNYRYIVVVSIRCPDGSEDSYPIVIDSDEPLTRDDIDALAARIFDNLLSSKYQRLAKFDINRRLGDECHETMTVSEAWRREA